MPQLPPQALQLQPPPSQMSRQLPPPQQAHAPQTPAKVPSAGPAISPPGACLSQVIAPGARPAQRMRTAACGGVAADAVLHGGDNTGKVSESGVRTVYLAFSAPPLSRCVCNYGAGHCASGCHRITRDVGTAPMVVLFCTPALSVAMVGSGGWGPGAADSRWHVDRCSGWMGAWGTAISQHVTLG